LNEFNEYSKFLCDFGQHSNNNKYKFVFIFILFYLKLVIFGLDVMIRTGNHIFSKFSHLNFYIFLNIYIYIYIYI